MGLIEVDRFHYGTIQRHSIVGIIKRLATYTKTVESKMREKTQDAETQLRTPQSLSGAVSKKGGVKSRLSGTKRPGW
jgi:hypothetical protein